MLVAPWIEHQLRKTAPPELQPGPVVVAHPASIVLALLLARTQSAAPLQRAVALVLEPASEYGQKGMDELHQQTVNLLSFQPLPKKFFDVQVAFNMVAQFGEQSAASLAATFQRITDHYRKIADGQSIVPSVLAVQAPIFHGHGIALNLQFEAAADVAQISAALAGDHISVIDSPQEAPNNVNAAGQGEILVSVIKDASDARSVWLWAASDNLRVAAINAVECAESMATSRPRGQVQ